MFLIFIINNAGDIVTHLPPDNWGYTHEGQLILLGQDEETMTDFNKRLTEYQKANGK